MSTLSLPTIDERIFSARIKNMVLQEIAATYLSVEGVMLLSKRIEKYEEVVRITHLLQKTTDIHLLVVRESLLKYLDTN